RGGTGCAHLPEPPRRKAARNHSGRGPCTGHGLGQQQSPHRQLRVEVGMHASPARALGLVPVTAISAAVLPVIAQGIDTSLTAAQCDSVVANAIANPTNADTLRLVRFCPDAFGPTIADLLTDRTDLLSGNQATYFLIVDLAMKYIEDDVWD